MGYIDAAKKIVKNLDDFTKILYRQKEGKLQIPCQYSGLKQFTWHCDIYRHHAADFAMPAARLYRYFPAGATVKRQKGGTGHDQEEDFTP